MNKYAFLWIFVTLTVVFISGCAGHWCTDDSKYCIEGFNGPSRIQTFQHGVYYPYSDLVISNSLKSSKCYLSVIVDGEERVERLEKGQYTRIKIYNNPGENRNASILIKKYCGKEENFAAEWEHAFGVSAIQPVSATWSLTDAHFQKNAFVWR